MALTILPGLPVSNSDFKTNSLFLNDNTSVPSTAQMLGACAFAQTGEAYICLVPAGGSANQTVSFIGGRAVRGDGAQIVVVSGTPTSWINGLGYTTTGALCVNTTAPVRFPNGIGTSEGGVASMAAVA